MPQIDLHGERQEVRQIGARKPTPERRTIRWTTSRSSSASVACRQRPGAAIGRRPVGTAAAAPHRAPTRPACPRRRPRRRKAARTGKTVEHPKYGTGTVVRREGEGR